MNKPYIATLQSLLHENADPKTRDWWEGYVKNGAPFIGVKMPLIRSLLHGWHKEFVSKHDQALVKSVIQENIRYFSTESLRNATKYFSKDESSVYLRMLGDGSAVQSKI